MIVALHSTAITRTIFARHAFSKKQKSRKQRENISRPCTFLAAIVFLPIQTDRHLLWVDAYRCYGTAPTLVPEAEVSAALLIAQEDLAGPNALSDGRLAGIKSLADSSGPCNSSTRNRQRDSPKRMSSGARPAGRHGACLLNVGCGKMRRKRVLKHECPCETGPRRRQADRRLMSQFRSTGPGSPLPLFRAGAAIVRDSLTLRRSETDW